MAKNMLTNVLHMEMTRRTKKVTERQGDVCEETGNSSKLKLRVEDQQKNPDG